MIHYHGTPLSGDNLTAVRVLRGKHGFVSFADPGQLELVAEVCQSFALDNGAFSAWKQGGNIDLEAYAAWVTAWHMHPGFDFYVIPDVIDGTAGDNLRMLASWAKTVPAAVWRKGAPVWHMHEPCEVLAELCAGHDRVCIGSSGDYATVGDSAWWGRMAEAMPYCTNSEGYPLVKLHGLRMLDPTVFSHLPLASADSTNMARNIGLDGRWHGPYSPRSKETRAAIIMERIEYHASAARWCGSGVGAQANFELFG